MRGVLNCSVYLSVTIYASCNFLSMVKNFKIDFASPCPRNKIVWIVEQILNKGFTVIKRKGYVFIAL